MSQNPDQQPYPFFRLYQINRWLLPLLIIPAVLTLVGFTHGAISIWLLQDFTPGYLLSVLPEPLHTRLIHDSYLRFAQIGTTLIALTFFFTAWLYLAARNLNLLHDLRRQSFKNSLVIFMRLMLGIAFALRMMLSMWRRSRAPESAEPEYRGLVPIWWTVLIAANVLKIFSVLKLQNAITLADWEWGFALMIFAYVLYFALYILTWRLVVAFDRLQHEHHGYHQNLSAPMGKSV